MLRHPKYGRRSIFFYSNSGKILPKFIIVNSIIYDNLLLPNKKDTSQYIRKKGAIMKNKMKKIVFYFIAVTLCGCVPSLHPLFTENELTFDANLIGIWAPADSNETWEFKPGEKNHYECIYIDQGKIGRFDTRLGRLGNTMFLDIYPEELNISENDFYKAHFVAMHTFMMINLTKDTLSLRAMNPDDFEKFVKTKPNAVKYENLGDKNLILTASTKELQVFMLKYGVNEKYQLFGQAKEADKMHRISPQTKDVNNAK